MSDASAALSPEPESPPPTPESTPPASAEQGRSRVKRIVIPLILLALGVSLGLVAFLVVYPPPEAGIPAPAYSKIIIITPIPVSFVGFNVVQRTPARAEVGVAVVLSHGTSATRGRNWAEIALSLPIGTTFSNCHGYAICENHTSITPSSAGGEVTFVSGKATALFNVAASNFAVDFNGINAYAAIPEVELQLDGAGSESPVLGALFHIPSANTYDWSSFPTDQVKSSFAIWSQSLTIGENSGRVTVGINHALQARDDNLIFLAGALVGVAGAAILSAIQEALHAFD